MKKKLLIVLGSLVAILGIVYLSGYFDGGEVTAADNEQGETTNNELKDVYDDMETPFDDENTEDSQSDEGEDVDFDPNEYVD